MEGIINSKFKIQNSKFKRLRLGFTLVEITVVMSIISVMFLMGVSTLLSIRDQATADQMSEEVITMVREAQNKSISIQKDSFGNSTKVWGVNFDTSTARINLVSVFGLTPTDSTIERSYSFNAGTNLDPDAYIYFASPFGTPYLNISNNAYSWIDSGRATKEYKPDPAFTPSASNATITINYKGHVRTIIIKANGDVHES